MARTKNARLILLPLALTLMVLCPIALAQFSVSGLQQGGVPFFPSGQASDQSRRLQRGQQALSDCQIDRLTASEPSYRVEGEAGFTEYWNRNDQKELQCAGVSFIRREVEPKGLVLPHYTNAPSISYVIRGKALYGMISPGCPETYESSSQESSHSEESRRSERGSEEQRDQHQKIRRLRRGDVIVSNAGMTKWLYNDGDEPLTYVTLFDSDNFQNQLDTKLRNFHLAGNPQGRKEPVSEGRQHDRRRHHEPSHERHQSRESQENEGNNLFSGFDEELLSEVFQVDRETINKIQAHNDERGPIIRVERDLELLIPEYDQEEQQRSERSHHGRGARGRDNGIEETLCAANYIENIDNPEKADVFNPQGGRLTALNSHTLPILSYLRLSAERVKLYQNAIMTPNWKINAHNIVYFTKGSGRVQVANNEGRLVFDDTVQEGQLLVIPQNFVVLKKADQDGLEWVALLTNDQAMTSPLAGRISAIRGMPEEVVMNSYGLSREEAKRLKYGRQELSVFSPSQKSQRRGERVAVE